MRRALLMGHNLACLLMSVVNIFNIFNVIRKVAAAVWLLATSTVAACQ